jgi:hypothetical protein
MIRNLYRAYLYVVCIILLIVVTVAVNALLGALLSQTPLRGAEGPPATRSDVVQAATFAIVALIVAGLIGGLHYRLLRRDLRAEPAAGGGAVRAFFLDIPQAIAALIAIGAFASAIATLSFPEGDAAYSLAAALAAAGFYAVVEWERRRATARTRVALALQRLRLYGVPFVTVLIAAGYWMSAVTSSLDALLTRLGLATQCNDVGFPAPSCVYGNNISPRYLIAQWAAVLWLGAAWLAYTWLSRGDGRSALRQVLHLAGFAAGLIFAVVGTQRGVEAAFRAIFRLPVTRLDVVEGSYGFVGPLTFGLVVLAAYLVLYLREADVLPTGRVVGMQSLRALAGFIFAVPFWWGCGLVLQHIVQNAVPAGSRPGSDHLATALSVLIAGLGYPPLALALARGGTTPETAGPRRAFVLALLAGGTVAGVIGLVVALRAVITRLLGAPLEDWQHVALDGAVTFAIGAIIAGLYGWLAARERAFTLPVSLAPAAPAPAETGIEGVLDALLAGTITRDEAAAQIRQLARSGG